VGKPGANPDGSAVVTANALNLPDLICGIPAPRKSFASVTPR